MLKFTRHLSSFRNTSRTTALGAPPCLSPRPGPTAARLRDSEPGQERTPAGRTSNGDEVLRSQNSPPEGRSELVSTSRETKTPGSQKQANKEGSHHGRREMAGTRGRGQGDSAGRLLRLRCQTACPHLIASFLSSPLTSPEAAGWLHRPPLALTLTYSCPWSTFPFHV